MSRSSEVRAVDGMWLLYDASKREVSTQPQLNVLPHAYLADVDALPGFER